jgi:peptidoglycan/xylan/chitin deacetylase (PgdA/CDA1 family)
MRNRPAFTLVFLVVLILSILSTSACGSTIVSSSGLSLVEITNTLSPIPSPSMTPISSSTPTATQTLLPTPTRTPTRTYTPTYTATPTPTPTATWAYFDPGFVEAPILLYHHISESPTASQYYVTPENFRAQMQLLYNWGYTSITPTQLAQVLLSGGELPSRPVIITFDDGDLDVYMTAFPVMQEFGFVGAFYIVTSYIGGGNFITEDQIKDLYSAGWEIGSHSTSHLDLTVNHDLMNYELVNSKIAIQEIISDTVNTVAYPYGKIDEYVISKTRKYGYQAGMGLGITNIHTLGSIFYLNRREVKYDADLDDFATLLPWGEPVP